MVVRWFVPWGLFFASVGLLLLSACNLISTQLSPSYVLPAPVLRTYDVSPSQNPYLTLDVSNLPYDAGTELNIYADASCQVLGAMASTGGAPFGELQFSFKAAGTFQFSVDAVDSSGTKTPCSNSVTYVVLPLSPPSQLTLYHPSASSGYIATPELMVQSAGAATVTLFSDSNCHAAVGTGSTDPYPARVTQALTPGAYSFYAKATGPTGIVSACSSASVSYTYLTPRLAFSSAQGVALDFAPGAVVAADFNGDGILDLLGASQSAHIALALATGSHSYGVPQTIASDLHYSSVAAADFNQDGREDFVAAVGDQGLFKVFLGNADGSFQVPIGLTGKLTNFWYGSSAVIATDLNGDGYPDIAAAAEDSVSVFLGNGNGGFATRVDYATASGCRSIAAGDLDGNATVDLVAGNEQGKSVSVLLNDGTGAFAPAVNYPTTNLVTSVAVGDVTSDGSADILVATRYSDSLFSLTNNGSGSFSTGPSAVIPTTDGDLESIHVADLDSDGHLDTVVAYGSGQDVSVFFGHGDGTWESNIEYLAGTSSGGASWIGDLDGDGDIDVVGTSKHDSTSGALELLWSQQIP